ncbi:hypothetical protein SPD57_03300 [Streptococcus sp. BJSWXB6CM1]|jgi:ribonuclease R|uniref:DUF3139 domain-containing protein n=1 Tax=Streptococcus fermentans TaxID=3095082 RepID=A0ABU5FXV1_9STRE|nr:MULTISPECIES: hypothetical protein [unclassified Streptococcus]MDY4345720.1 hypothetical protein [Streptococcus sp. BJSWXB5TM5]MDY4360812.1 hypothetical protein [Streptococcus sp. BJSWXB3CM3]MDY4370945.1 hypothetical protein [Streptococcus sp. BJSWXB6CM1]
MREMKLLIYSTFAFMLFLILSVNFIDILIPLPDTETKTVQKIDETIYHFYLKDGIVTGKFYNDDGYFLVVYNEKSKDFEIEKVEEKYWEHQQIDQY